jgi:hypothetical protein
MLPELPEIDPKVNGVRSGWLLNRICDRIVKQRLISSDTVKVDDTAQGQVINIVAPAEVTAVTALGFSVSLTASGIRVAAGVLTYPQWGAVIGGDPNPTNWTTQVNYVGGTLGATSQVWLQVLWTQADTETIGPLGAVTKNVSGGKGGRGGGGGGGGAAKGTTAEEPTFGEGGQDGIAGGAGGAGGVVLTGSPPAPMTGLGNSSGASGAAGGYGGAGSDGTTVSFTRATKATAQIRRWAISGVSLHPSKGSPDQASSWIQLASVVGSNIDQHVCGLISITPPAFTFIPA